MRVVWRETGVSMSTAGAKAPNGYGRELIEQALPFQLQARTSYVLTEDGVQCTIAAPIISRSLKG